MQFPGHWWHAVNTAKKLYDLSGTAGMPGFEPGQNGPFEELYRILDVAATMLGHAPGADTAKWQSMYGNIDYTGISQAFQSGDLLNEPVFSKINWTQLAQMTQAQMQTDKMQQFAGQAAANLYTSGKPLTLDNMKAEVDKLSNEDSPVTKATKDVAQKVSDGTTAVTGKVNDVKGATDNTTAAITTMSTHARTRAALSIIGAVDKLRLGPTAATPTAPVPGGTVTTPAPGRGLVPQSYNLAPMTTSLSVPRGVFSRSASIAQED